MHANRKSHQEGNEYYPSVGILFIRYVLPFQNCPENQCCKECRRGIHFSFNSRKPERVCKRISYCAYNTGSHNCNNPSGSIIGFFFQKYFPGQMCNGPEQKENCKCTRQC